MMVPVRTRSGDTSIEIEFANHFSPSSVEEWRQALSAKSTEQQCDAVEYLESVVSKWALYDQKGRLARSTGEISERLEKNEKCEVLGAFVASAPWFCNGTVAGFCQFRRTWCNNIVFDFLGVHPSLLSHESREISGLGTALLYRLAVEVRALKAGVIWAETTDTSAPFYSKVFDIPSLADLLVVESDRFCEPLVSAIEVQQK